MKEVICKVELGGGICVREFYSPVQKLVRCKDCRYWEPMNRFHQDYHPGRGECEWNCWVRDSDWFCADGEERLV